MEGVRVKWKPFVLRAIMMNKGGGSEGGKPLVDLLSNYQHYCKVDGI